MRVQNILPISVQRTSPNNCKVTKQNNANCDNVFLIHNVSFGKLPLNFGVAVIKEGEGILYRSGQLTEENLSWLRNEKKIDFIIDLAGNCRRKNENEAKIAKRLGMNYRFEDGINLYKNGGYARVADIIEKLVKEGGNVLIHCSLGEGRTGEMVAYYQTKKLEMAEADVIKHCKEYHGSENTIKMFLSEVSSGSIK